MIWKKNLVQNIDFILDDSNEDDDNLYMYTVTMTEYFLFGIKVAETYYDIFDKSTYKHIEEEEEIISNSIGFNKKKKD